jgi:anti-sigma regulatory factor (Ser/Thr protein kinase)
VVAHRHNRRPFASPGTIRRRLIGLLVLPLAAVVGLLGFVGTGPARAHTAATATTHAVSVAGAVRVLVQRLQTERGLVAGLPGDAPQPPTRLGPAQSEVDGQRAALGRLIRADHGALGARVTAALHELDGLAAARAATVDTTSRAAAFRFYTDRITALNRLDLGLDNVADARLRAALATQAALADLTEHTAQEQAFLGGVFTAGAFDAADQTFARFAAIRAAKAVALRDFTTTATPDQESAADATLDSTAAHDIVHFEQVAQDAADGRPIAADPHAWWTASGTVLDGLRQAQGRVDADLRARARALRDDSARRLATLAGLALLLAVGTAVLLMVAARSISRPVGRLADEASQLATAHLPTEVRRILTGDAAHPTPTGDTTPAHPDTTHRAAPGDTPAPRLDRAGRLDVADVPHPVRVPPAATVEVRRVAAALDRVQALAFSLATEQAALRRRTGEVLADLGRRNQNLLRRQLALIAALDPHAHDPTGRAALFELDHLATRLRRNAESLLVLAGAAGPGRWTTSSAAVPMVDVIRAAGAQVEQYRRVTFRRVDDALVRGTAAPGLAHLVAELVENGLTYSAPDVEVEVQGRRIGEVYLIAVTDQGVGMSADDLATANARLGDERDFMEPPARYLGHFVVGRLARELGVSVELAPSPVTGITARVLVPADRLARPPELAEPTRVEATAGAPITGAPTPAPRPDPAPVPGPAAATVPVVEYRTTGTAPPPERTANGLRKRAPREARPAGVTHAPYGPHDPADLPSTLDDSPSQVQTRLSALRAGVRRSVEDRSASE